MGGATMTTLQVPLSAGRVTLLTVPSGMSGGPSSAGIVPDGAR